MALLALTLAAAILVGWLTGGRLAHLDRLRLRGGALVGVSLLAQLGLATGVGGARRLVLLAVAQAALTAFCWCNRRVTGIPLIAVGFTCNAAVMAANGAMPVSADAIRRVAGPGAGVVVARGRHQLLESGDPLPWLADVLPVPPLGVVLSVGDVVLGAGIVLLVTVHMRQHGGTRAASS